MYASSKPVFRFAPSPNGHLHLGHGLSALLNAEAASKSNGIALLRIENIDEARCTQELERDLFEDLRWLGYPLAHPVMRQNERFGAYALALSRLKEMGLVYRAYLTRAEIKRFVSDYEYSGATWPRDPDGAPLYPGDRQVLSDTEIKRRNDEGHAYTLRLDMAEAVRRLEKPLLWTEAGAEGKELARKPLRVQADPTVWGDVVLARKDTPTSYHLSVVVDDAEQEVSDVLRGLDLYHATSVHRLLQELLTLPEPVYRHHRLIVDAEGRKLSKSAKDTSLRSLREQGASLSDIRSAIGLVDAG